jgi:hypothetical protein
MVRFKFKKQRKYYLFSGRTIRLTAGNSLRHGKTPIEILEAIKRCYQLSFHFFVWNHPELMILFSSEISSEHFIMKEIEEEYLYAEGFALEDPYLCEPIFNSSRAWEAYVESYRLTDQNFEMKFNSYEMILRGQRGGYIFEDLINLITNPVGAINKISKSLNG